MGECHSHDTHADRQTVNTESFAHADVASRIAVSLGVGLLVGLEREWAHNMQRYFGGAGFLLLSGLGGLVSSASATASAASLAASGTITPETAAVATILTSMTSAVVHVPVVYYQGGRGRLFAGLVQNSVLVVVLGLATLSLHAVSAW